MGSTIERLGSFFFRPAISSSDTLLARTHRLLRFFILCRAFRLLTSVFDISRSYSRRHLDRGARSLTFVSFTFRLLKAARLLRLLRLSVSVNERSSVLSLRKREIPEMSSTFVLDKFSLYRAPSFSSNFVSLKSVYDRSTLSFLTFLRVV